MQAGNCKNLISLFDQICYLEWWAVLVLPQKSFHLKWRPREIKMDKNSKTTWLISVGSKSRLNFKHFAKLVWVSVAYIARIWSLFTILLCLLSAEWPLAEKFQWNAALSAVSRTFNIFFALFSRNVFRFLLKLDLFSTYKMVNNMVIMALAKKKPAKKQAKTNDLGTQHVVSISPSFHPSSRPEPDLNNQSSLPGVYSTQSLFHVLLEQPCCTFVYFGF